MIITREIKIPVTDKLSSEYIESALADRGLDVLRWAITDVNCDFYVLNISLLA